MIKKYSLEFILETRHCLDTSFHNSLTEFAEALEITGLDSQPKDEISRFKLNMVTEEPEAVFDICAQIGRIKAVRINEGEAAS
ncbi:MAG: hypothetical protein AB1481_00190 [Candidatus Omnitrophota bacterium]